MKKNIQLSKDGSTLIQIESKREIFQNNKETYCERENLTEGYGKG